MRDFIDDAVFQFEDVLPELEFVPLAARRALDIAGVRVTLEAWRSLTLGDRRALVAAGAPEDVDVEQVLAGVRRATPPATRIAPTPDPDPLEPPESITRALGIGRCLDARTWSELRSLDRFAIVHGYRRAVAKGTPTQLEVTFDAIVGPPRTPTHPMQALPPMTPTRPMDALPLMTPARPMSALSPPTPSRPLEVGQRVGGSAVGRMSTPLDRAARGPITADRPGYSKPGAYSISTPPPPPRQDSPRSQPISSGERAPSPRPPRSTHLDEHGEVHMVPVSDKQKTVRRAVARGTVRMKRETAELIATGKAPKGEVLATARVAGILAAKRTPDLVPLCHHVALTRVSVELEVDVNEGCVEVLAMTEAVDRTGVEMEAMVAVSIACLTLYDMLKGVDRDIEITKVFLAEKIGGKTGHWVKSP
jgi:cyclic pyranopterin phosphate synthase